MASLVKRGAAVALGLLSVVGGYAVLLSRPEMLFRHRLEHPSFLVHSRTPLPESIVAALDSAAFRLAASPLAQRNVARVFVTGTPGWHAFFTGPGRHAMAKNYELGNSIYVPMLDAPTLEVVHFDGRRAPIASILAHEAAHTEFQRAVGGARALWRLPFWKKEGYSEFVAYGDSVRLGDMVTALRSTDATITWPRSNPVPRRYFEAEAAWRYLVEVRRMSVAQIVNTREPIPVILREMMSALPAADSGRDHRSPN